MRWRLFGLLLLAANAQAGKGCGLQLLEQSGYVAVIRDDRLTVTHAKGQHCFIVDKVLAAPVILQGPDHFPIQQPENRTRDLLMLQLSHRLHSNNQATLYTIVNDSLVELALPTGYQRYAWQLPFTCNSPQLRKVQYQKQGMWQQALVVISNNSLALYSPSLSQALWAKTLKYPIVDTAIASVDQRWYLVVLMQGNRSAYVEWLDMTSGIPSGMRLMTKAKGATNLKALDLDSTDSVSHLLIYGADSPVILYDVGTKQHSIINLSGTSEHLIPIRASFGFDLLQQWYDSTTRQAHIARWHIEPSDVRLVWSTAVATRLSNLKVFSNGIHAFDMLNHGWLSWLLDTGVQMGHSRSMKNAGSGRKHWCLER